ncbi:MAG: glycosyltransferase [Planctomycetes bacterium]|nr:glycosyltransferase [Planctomycetota bacterium]
MRILHVTHEFPPYEFAGTAIYTYNIVKALSERHELFVFSRLEDKSVAPYELIDEDRGKYRVRLISRPELQWTPFENSYTDARAEKAFTDYLDEIRPDVVHFQHLLGLSWTCVEEVKKRQIGVVFTLHDFWTMCPMGQRMCYTDRELCEEIIFEKCGPCVFGAGWVPPEAPAVEAENGAAKTPSRFQELFDQRFRTTPGVFARRPRAWAWAALRSAGQSVGVGTRSEPPQVLTPHPFAKRFARMQQALGAADLLITPSSFLRDEFIRLFDVAPERIIHSHNGMTFDHVVAHPPTESDVLRFGFVGSVIPTKGVHVLVEAAKKLAKLQGFRVDIYGAPNRWTVDYEKECHTAAKGLDHVVFHGRFDNKKIGEVLSKIDVLVVPSIWYENAPLTLNEAGMTGTPVLVSDKGGMLEFVRDNRYGRTFKLGDPEDLAREMRRLIEDRSLVAGLVGKKPWIKPVAENATELEAIYDRIARGKPALA